MTRMLHLRDRVVNQYGIKGVILPEMFDGTYPYTVETDAGTRYAFVDYDGTSCVNHFVWVNISEPLPPIEYPPDLDISDDIKYNRKTTFNQLIKRRA